MTKAEWVIGKMEERGSDTTGLQIYECLFHPGQYCLGHEPIKFKLIIDEQVRMREIYRLVARLEMVITKQRRVEHDVPFTKIPTGKRQRRRERRKKAREQTAAVASTYPDYVAVVR